MIVISPRKILRLCFALLCLLTVAGLIASWLNTLAVDHALISEARESFVRLFRVDGEANIPAWYSSSLLLLSALVLAVIGKMKQQRHDGYTLHWVLLGIGFVYLSIDEAAVLHEMLNKPAEAVISPAGLLAFPWVIPGAIGVTLTAFLYTRFLFDLHPPTRRRFLVAGMLFVGGCLGMDSLGAWCFDRYGPQSSLYRLAQVVEECMEMLGASLFLYALLTYLSGEEEDLIISIGTPPPAAEEARRAA